MDGFGRLFGVGHEKGSVDNGLVWTLWMSLIHEFLRMQMSESIGILVPRPGIEPGPSAVKVLTFYNFFFIQKKKKKKKSPNHSTAREFWEWTFFFSFLPILLFLCQIVLTWWGSHFQEFCMKKKSLTLDVKKHLNVQNSVTFSPFFLWFSLQLFTNRCVSDNHSATRHRKTQFAFVAV